MKRPHDSINVLKLNKNCTFVSLSMQKFAAINTTGATTFSYFCYESAESLYDLNNLQKKLRSIRVAHANAMLYPSFISLLAMC